MNLVLDFEIPKSTISLTHGDGIVLQGSCFSDEMFLQLKKSGHTVSGNHFGTIFHPSMIAFNLLNLFEEKIEERIAQRDDLFFSWDASSSVFAYSKEELASTLKFQRESLLNELESAKILVVTFGTAWGYERTDTNELVANCHKFPATEFQKFLSSPYEMTQDWVIAIEKLLQFNRDLQIIFTVSPVRHIKDGLVENNLSKARLIEVVQQLALEQNCHYFPSYELLVDVLRDYRFYTQDLVHPSQTAIEFIYNAFESTYFSEKSQKVSLEVLKLRQVENHRSLFEQSEAHQNQIQKTNSKIEVFLKQNPAVVW